MTKHAPNGHTHIYRADLADWFCETCQTATDHCAGYDEVDPDLVAAIAEQEALDAEEADFEEARDAAVERAAVQRAIDAGLVPEGYDPERDDFDHETDTPADYEGDSEPETTTCDECGAACPVPSYGIRGPALCDACGRKADAEPEGVTTYTVTVSATFDRPLTDAEQQALLAEVVAQFEANDEHPEGRIHQFGVQS